MSHFLSPPLLFNYIVLFTAFNQIPISHSLQQPPPPPPFWVPNKCNEKCGHLQIPFPFHLTNSSCGLHSDKFKLSCLNSTTLNLNIGSQNYQVLDFFYDGILVDFPGIYSCRQYFDVNSFGFEGNEYYGTSIDNIMGLYDCDDSSICRVGCEKITVLGCERNSTSSSSSSCCYPLSDHSVWDIGDGLSVFSNFGCRGFSSWVQGKLGVKLEWAIPRNSSKDLCAMNGFVENSTAVKDGVRCKCQNGFTGDGFADGVGCLKSCVKDGHEEYGRDCSYTQRHKKKKALILAGFFASAFLVGSLAALHGLLKSPIKSGTTWDPDPGNDQSNISFRKASKTRLFAYEELDLATKGFDCRQKLVDGINGTVHAGILCDGLHVAVQKVHCKNEQDLIQVLTRVEILSIVSHRNLACLLGCCIDSDRTPLIVYQFSAKGTLEEHLNPGGKRKTGLDWYQRLIVAAEIASTLAYLQHEVSPPIYHHDLKSENIYLDQEYSIKIAGFGLLSSKEGTQFYRSDVYDFGVLLLEIIAGSKHIDLPNVALEKISSRKLEEIVDPLLYYHEQPQFRREQMERVADIASRCFLFGKDGRLNMMDVGRELIQITKDGLDGSVRRVPAIEETFSNSSLLQMISMSPDSSFVH